MIVKNGDMEHSRYCLRITILDERETHFYIFNLHLISDNSPYDSIEI